MTYLISPDDEFKINLAPASVVEEILQNARMILSTVKNSCPLDRNFGVNARFLDMPQPAAETILVGEIFGEVHNVRISFDTTIYNGREYRGSGGWWADNAKNQAEIWDESGKTGGFKDIHIETNPLNIVPQSAASFKGWTNTGDYGHVVFIEAVEVIDGETWVYFSDDWVNGGPRGKIKQMTLDDFINAVGHGEFQGYVQIL